MMKRQSFFIETYPIWLLALIKTALHFWVNMNDGIFRDELYYLACGNRLDFGYVDHPPFVALVAALGTNLFGDSVFAIRFFPTLAGAGVIVLTGLLTREMGGNRFAQFQAGLCVLLAPLFLGIHGFLSMNVFDHLFWVMALYLLMLIAKNDYTKSWALLGVVLGVGLLNKISVLFLGFGLFIGMLCTSYRRWFLRPGPWIAGSIAFLFFLPHILWQIAYDWPTLEFIHNAKTMKNVDLSPMGFIGNQIIELNPFFAPLWLAGLIWLAWHARYRLFAWMYLTILALLILQNGKTYYLAPLYPLLFAGGAIAIESGIARIRLHWLKPLLCVYIAITGLLLLPMALPILPPEKFIAYAETLRLQIPQQEKIGQGRLPQHFADRHGWPEMVEAVADVYQQLSPQEKEECLLVVNNYGEAGAMEYFGQQYGLPEVLCPHNNYYFWKPKNTIGRVAIVLSRSAGDLTDFFENIEPAGTFQHPYCMPYENNLQIFICREPKMDLDVIWPGMKSFG